MDGWMDACVYVCMMYVCLPDCMYVCTYLYVLLHWNPSAFPHTAPPPPPPPRAPKECCGGGHFAKSRGSAADRYTLQEPLALAESPDLGFGASVSHPQPATLNPKVRNPAHLTIKAERLKLS